MRAMLFSCSTFFQSVWSSPSLQVYCSGSIKNSLIGRRIHWRVSNERCFWTTKTIHRQRMYSRLIYPDEYSPNDSFEYNHHTKYCLSCFLSLEWYCNRCEKALGLPEQFQIILDTISNSRWESRIILRSRAGGSRMSGWRRRWRCFKGTECSANGW